MIVLELTEQEALNLRNLLDVAVRAEGMRAATFAIALDAKIVAAAQAAQAASQQQGNGGMGAKQ